MPNEKTADYGPLELLFGTWKGDKGINLSPEPSQDEIIPYYETIEFERAGDVDNADTQVLAIARYHRSVRKKETDETFHDQVGYWLWDKENQIIMHSFTIPRGMAILAGGMFESVQDKYTQATFKVATKLGEDEGLAQSPFLLDNAKTTAFTQELTVNETELSYSESTVLEIYGRGMDHTDVNTLKKVNE